MAAPQRAQLFLDALVAAIDVIDAVDQGLPIGRQPGKHQPGRCPQIGRHDRRGGQPVDPRTDSRIALELDVGAHALQLEYMLESILENSLGDCANALSHGIHRAELRLHIRRKRRVWGRADIH